MNSREAMPGRIYVDGFEKRLDKDGVYACLKCTQDSDVYEEVEESYQALLPSFFQSARPRAVLHFSEMSLEEKFPGLKKNQKFLYVIITLGKDVTILSNQLYEQGDYLSYMLADAMADTYLFGLEEELQNVIREECGKRGLGIEKRLEAPADLPMEAQKLAFEKTRAAEILHMGITSGLMLDPVKSNCILFQLTDDQEVFRMQHDCSKCTAQDCPHQKNKGIVISLEDGRKLSCRQGETVLQAFIRQGQRLAAVCGGRGVCGKCKIQVLQGSLPVTPEDEKFFSPQELEKGYRLSCRAVPDSSCTLRMCFDTEDSFEVLNDYGGEEASVEGMAGEGYVIGIDIGTTTIAMQLLGAQSRAVKGSYTTINHQRRFGADVISRIEASNQGKGPELQLSIREDLLEGIRSLVKKSGIFPSSLQKVGIGGNTTMIHLLMGYDCHTLGVAPFTPVNINTIRGSFQELLGSGEFSCPVVIFPGISTYVGGDIVAGLYHCGFDKKERPCVFLDLGTNGEIAVGNRDRILSTATAAGPAFEGGNVTFGVGSIHGAICSVTMESPDKVQVKTIGDQPPVGICGTGIIELMAQLLRLEIVDETGRMDEDFEDEFPLVKTSDGEMISFYQKDVREIQLAKSAVRAGMETLLQKYGASYDEIEKIYVAGGFGNKMNVESAAAIGLLPVELKEKFVSVGNSCLGGVIDSLFDSQAEEKISEILKASHEVNLGSDPIFNEQYMEHMMFPYEDE